MLKKVYFFCLFLFSFCFLFAVGKKDENILFELERKYPSEEYFFAVGTGLSRQVAESSAKFSISQVFGEKIEGNQSVYSYVDSNGINNQSINLEMTEMLSVDDLVGIQIKEVFFDEKGNYNCVAVLNKNEASNYYSNKISENEKKIKFLLKNIKSDNYSLQYISIFDEAIDLATQSDYYLHILSVLNPVLYKMNSFSYTSSAKLKNEKNNYSSKFSFTIDVTNDMDNILLNSISSVLLKHGCKIVESDSNYSILANIEFDDVELNDNKHEYVRFVFKSSIIDNSSQEIIYPYVYTGREGHLTKEQAKQRSMNKVDNQIKEEWLKRF